MYWFNIEFVKPNYPHGLGLIVFYEDIETLVWTPMLFTLPGSYFYAFMGS